MQDRDSASLRAGSWRTDSVTFEETSESVSEYLLGTFLKSQFLFFPPNWTRRTLNICYTSVHSIV